MRKSEIQDLSEKGQSCIFLLFGMFHYWEKEKGHNMMWILTFLFGKGEWNRKEISL